MPVMFVTQRGRTLRNEELTAAIIDERINHEYPGQITGYEYGRDTEFHVAVNHIVEWWDEVE